MDYHLHCEDFLSLYLYRIACTEICVHCISFCHCIHLIKIWLHLLYNSFHSLASWKQQLDSPVMSYSGRTKVVSAFLFTSVHDSWWSDQISIYFVEYSSSLSLTNCSRLTVCKALLESSAYTQNRAQSRVPHSAEYLFTVKTHACFLAQYQSYCESKNLGFQEAVFESQPAFLDCFALEETLNKLKSDLLEPREIILHSLSSFFPGS